MVYQSLVPLGTELRVVTAEGAVMSILNEWVAAPAGARFPARSPNAGLPTETAIPSPLLVFVPVFVVDGPAKPEIVSVAVNVAPTSALFQPAAFASGLWLV